MFVGVVEQCRRAHGFILQVAWLSEDVDVRFAKRQCPVGMAAHGNNVIGHSRPALGLGFTERHRPSDDEPKPEQPECVMFV